MTPVVAVSPRAATLHALRAATQFEIPEVTLDSCLVATPELVRGPERIASMEAVVRATLADGTPIPNEARGAALPVLGNIAEAVIEEILAGHGWQPVYDDDVGASAGHGVDLLMLDASLERMVAIEVKSTIQEARWPRLAAGRRQQLTPAWFDGPGNQGMTELELGSDDIYTMVVQIHLRRLRWRSCIAGDVYSPQPITHLDQLSDLGWLV